MVQNYWMSKKIVQYIYIVARTFEKKKNIKQSSDELNHYYSDLLPAKSKLKKQLENIKSKLKRTQTSLDDNFRAASSTYLILSMHGCEVY